MALIAVIALIAYFPSLNGGFVLDDNHLLTENELIAAPDGLYRFWCTSEAADYWPVSNTSLWIEWRLWGMNPTGYHVTNLILHIVEALLIWIILRKLSIPGAFFAAMIFAVHPVNVESVAWIAQRKDMLAVLFFLLSILWYLKAEMPSARECHAHVCRGHDRQPMAIYWYWLSLAAFVLAMLSKGSAVVLPVLLLGIVWWLRPLIRRDLVRIAPFFAVAVVLAVVNVWFQTHGTEKVFRTADFAERLLGAGGVVWFYLYKALLPVDLAFIYPQWRIDTGNLLWWLPLFAVLVVTAALWRYRETWARPFLFAWGFFCLALTPIMGFIDVGFMKYSLVADHYQHIAIIGVIVLAAAGWSIWHRQSQGTTYTAAKIIAILAVGVLAFLTWRQSGLYCDAITLYNATLEKNPECWMAHNNLGGALIQADRLPEAIDHYEQALRLKSDYFDVHNNLGVALVQTGRPEEAIVHYKKALSLKPDYPEAHNNLAVALIQTKRLQQAIEHYREAVTLRSDYPEAHNNLGDALIQIGRPEEAIKHYEQAVRLKPDYVEAHNNLGFTLTQTGRPEEAIEHFEQALLLKPDFSEARYNLGNTLLQLGKYREAIEHYRKFLRLNPDSPEVYNNLGAALVQTGRFQEAIECYRQAIRVKPDYINAYKNLALAYADMRQPSEAIAAAQKALELARSQAQTAEVKQIEDWLNSYRAGMSDRPKTPPPSQSVNPAP